MFILHIFIYILHSHTNISTYLYFIFLIYYIYSYVYIYIRKYIYICTVYLFMSLWVCTCTSTYPRTRPLILPSELLLLSTVQRMLTQQWSDGFGKAPQISWYASWVAVPTTQQDWVCDPVKRGRPALTGSHHCCHQPHYGYRIHSCKPQLPRRGLTPLETTARNPPQPHPNHPCHCQGCPCPWLAHGVAGKLFPWLTKLKALTILSHSWIPRERTVQADHKRTCTVNSLCSLVQA